MKQIIYFPSEEMLNTVKQKADEKTMSMSAYIRIALLEKWEREENEENARRNGE